MLGCTMLKSKEATVAECLGDKGTWDRFFISDCKNSHIGHYL